MGDLKMEYFASGDFAANCIFIYSLKSKDAIVIDPGYTTQTLIKIIKERELNVKHILHTHAHFDHIGESNKIKRLTGASMHLHASDLFLYDNLQEQAAMYGFSLDNLEKIDFYITESSTFGLPEAGYEKILKVIHTPGHSPGSVCFYSDIWHTPVCFSGDTLFANSIGRTDLPGGDRDTLLESIRTKLYSLPEYTEVIPGHGPATTILNEQENNPFVSASAP